MAQYGYSTPYAPGRSESPLPPGYMEAATAPGRNLAMGIVEAGRNIGAAIERYRAKKAENEAADQSRDTIVGLTQQALSSDPKYIALQRYMETGALPQGVSQDQIDSYTQQVMADREMLNKMAALNEKFPDMSAARKKAALGDMVMVLNQYQQRQQQGALREMQDLQTRLAASQLEDIANRRRQQDILMSGIRYGLEQPTTTTQTQQVTDTIEFPPLPGATTPAVQSTPSQAEATAARYFMGRYGQAAQQLQQYGADLGKQANALNVSQTPRFTGPISLGQEDVNAYLSQQFESPIQAAARAEANVRLKQQQLAESQAALQQAGIMEKSPALQTIGPRTLQPAQETQPIQQAPETITRNVSTQVPISYEDQSKRLTQYLIQQGAKPETIAMVPQILSMVGQQKPTKVEQVGNIGSIIRFGDKEQFVPAKEANLENILKVRGLTIDFPEFQGQANTESEAKDFREQYATNLKLREQVADLLELTKLGKTQLQTPDNKAKAQGLSRAIKATMRKEILGEGVVSDKDQAILDTVIPDPTVLFSWPSANKTALESLVSRANSNLDVKAKAYGLQPVNAKTSQGISGLKNDPRVAVIRAKAASGAITRQQAEKELLNLK